MKRMCLPSIIVSVAAMVTAASAQNAVAPLPATTFSYPAMPLDVKTVSQLTANGIVRRYVSFSTPSGAVSGEIVAPGQHRARGGGVLFVHWLGDPQTTNLTEFEPDAIELAKHGATSLLIDAMWAQPRWFMNVRVPETDYANSIRQVIALRRALDVLVAQNNVDPHRIAFVGHDFGAMYGAVLSGVDERPQWYTLIAGNPSFSEWYLLGHKPADQAAYVAQMAPLDPGLYLARSRAQSFLFQFAQTDKYIPPGRQIQFFQSAPAPRAMFVYKADHAVHVRAAFEDRMAWLTPKVRAL
jgi:dienelactone hydrolase